jgi:hypothetical protein
VREEAFATRRYRLLLGLGTLVLLELAGWLTVQLLHQRPSMSKANFDRLEEGMTEKEVDDILGTERWNYTPSILSATGLERWWVADDGMIMLDFAPRPPLEDWQVTHKHYLELPPEPVLDRIRRWLPW